MTPPVAVPHFVCSSGGSRGGDLQGPSVPACCDSSLPCQKLWKPRTGALSIFSPPSLRAQCLSSTSFVWPFLPHLTCSPSSRQRAAVPRVGAVDTCCWTSAIAAAVPLPCCRLRLSSVKHYPHALLLNAWSYGKCQARLRGWWCNSHRHGAGCLQQLPAQLTGVAVTCSEEARAALTPATCPLPSY